MYFLIPIALRILVGNVGTAWLIKKASGKEGRERRFLLQYLVAGLLAGAIVYAAFGGWSFNATFWLIAGIGFANGLAAYCQWRAVDISLSKTSLFTWMDDVIVVNLALWQLGEFSIVNRTMAAGIVLSLAALVLFAVHDAVKKKGSSEKRRLTLYLWIGAYSIVWGLAPVVMRHFALEGLPLASFLQPWYWGAFAAAAVLFVVTRRASRGVSSGSLPRDTLVALGLGAGILGSLALAYWALQLAPLVVVQPIFLISEMVFPALIGLFGFSEGKTFTRFEWLCFGLGVVGVCLVAYGFAHH